MTNTLFNSPSQLMIAMLIVMFLVSSVSYKLGAKKPWRKTRYFTDCDCLWRWKYGQNKSEKLYQYWTNFSWKKSVQDLSWLLKNKQEITALQAYRMFPRAFKK